MRRSTVLLSTAAVLVLGAGMVAGRLSSYLKPVESRADHRDWFHDQLGLSADQKKNMDAIWADTKQQLDKLDDARHGLDRDRDASIRAMLTPEELVKYDQIFADSRAKHQELDKKRHDLMAAANRSSRDLLTREQQVKWDAMQKDMHEHDHRGPGGPGPGHSHGGPMGPTTGLSAQVPATQAAP